MNFNFNLSDETLTGGLMDGLSVFCEQSKLNIKEIITLDRDRGTVARLCDESVVECKINSPGILSIVQKTCSQQRSYRLTRNAFTWTVERINETAVITD